MDWKLISEETPSSIYTGRVWLKPSTGAAYLRLGDSWITIGTQGSETTDYHITLLINGIDKTQYLRRQTLIIDDILTQEVNTCSFTFDDLGSGNKPEIGNEIIIMYKQTSISTPTIIFAGKIMEPPELRVSVQKYIYEIQCSDYTQDLMKRQVADTYENMSAGDIIKDIVNNYAPELGTFHVQDGIEIEYIQFNYVYPNECIIQLAELIGYDWYVDYERNIHFFSRTTNEAPYELKEDGTGGEYRDLFINVDKSQLINSQTVRGGYEFSDLYTQERVADGTQVSFNLDYEAFTPISVYVDTGGGYAAKTLAVDNIVTTGYDFVYNEAEKVIKNLDYAVLTSGHKIKITYKYKKPILARVEDTDSILAMINYEGGNGVYEGQLIIDETIETKESARDRARAEINQYSNPIVTGTFITTEYGYKSGQLLTINISSRNIDTQYLIHQVNTVSLGNGVFEYEITFSTKLKGLTDFLIGLYDDSRGLFVRTDELIDVLKVLTDSFEISASVPTESRRSMTTNPYVWCNDGGTTPDKGQWNLAEWG